MTGSPGIRWCPWQSQRQSPTPDAPSAGIGALAERYDPDAIDLPGGEARVRLEIDGGRAWDAVLTRRKPEPPAGARRHASPTRTLTADAATWRQIAADVRGGMGAFRRGRLRIRGSLHVGVGFLAATSGADRGVAAHLRVGAHPKVGRLSILSAGAGKQTLICAHGLGGTKASFLPTVAALAERYRVVALDLPGFGESDKPIARPLQRPLLRPLGVRADGRARPRPRPPGGQQHGRPGGDRGRPDGPRAAWTAGAAQPRARLAARPALGADRQGAAARARPAPDRPAPDRRGRGAPVRGRARAAGPTPAWTSSCARTSPRAAAPRSTPPRATSTSTSPTARTASGRGWPSWRRARCSSGAASDTLVPIAFMKHVEEALPAARHLELDCGHVPQLEARARRTRDAQFSRPER